MTFLHETRKKEAPYGASDNTTLLCNFALFRADGFSRSHDFHRSLG
jgi:hypothetical protein